jgi:hypothetical protein
MKDITTGAPANRAEVVYEVEFNAVELDLLYELTRQARNSLPDPYDTPEPGSWAASIIALDDKLTSLFHKRRC